MAYYEVFDVKKVNREGYVEYRPRGLDIFEIESFEYVDEEHTKVFTKSGDSFVARVHYDYVMDLCMSTTDDYGLLFTFYPN